MSRSVGVASLLLVSCLMACGGGDDDAGGDGDGDGDGTTDAAPGPDAPATVMITGVAQTIMGTATAPLAGATIEGFARAGGAALGSTTSGADGTYTLTLTTGGAAIDGYLKGSSSGRLDTYLYPPRPVAADTTGATMLIINQATLNLLGGLAGTTQQASKGFIGLIVADAAGTPIAGAKVTIDPAGSAEILYAANGLPNANADATDASGAVFIANTNTGDVTVDATMGSTDFHAVTVNARAGAITTTLLQP